MVLISVFLYTVRFPYFKRIDFRTRQVRFSALRRTITGFLEVGVWNRFIGFRVNAVGFSTALFLDFHQPRILQLPQGVDRFLPPAAEQSDHLADGVVVVVKHFCNTLFENSPGISSFKWCFPIIVGMRTDMIVPYVHISV